MSVRLLPSLLLLLALGLSAADLPQVPASSRWLLHLDVSQALAGPPGTWLREQLAQRPEVATKLAGLIALTGFDPWQDLQAISIVGDGQPEVGLILVRGRFEAQRLEGLALLAPQGQRHERAGQVWYSWHDQDKDRPMQGALVGELLLLSAQQELLFAGIDALAGHAALADDGELLSLLQPALPGSLAVAAATDLGELGQGPQAALFRQVRRAAMSIGLDDQQVALSLRLESADPSAAQRVAQLVQGLLVLVSLMDDDAHAQMPLLRSLSEIIQVERSGAAVGLRASVGLDLVRSALERRLGGE